MVLRPGPPKKNSWQISVCERGLSERECSDLQRQSYHYLHGQHTAQMRVLYGSGSRLLSPQADTAGMQGILCRAPNRRVPDANVCSTCGTREPAQGHECTPKCAICGDDHITSGKLCKKKLKHVPPTRSRVDQPERRRLSTQKTSSTSASTAEVKA